MMRRLSLFAAALVGLAAGWLLIAPGPGPTADLRAAGLRWLFVGQPLMQIQAPLSDHEVVVGAVDVLIAFAASPRVAVETLQCLLNGGDVTSELTFGRNGAVGSIVGLHEGENEIRIRVFGKPWWGDAYVDE